MHIEVKSRDWVKNAAIIFLSILLVLTFFSNTILNRSLPEVTTQMVEGGSIVAKVRGTGTVVANGSYQEKATQTREIRAVLIKSGQQINAGDPMFVLGQGDSEELEALQEQLRSLQVSYQRASINSQIGLSDEERFPLEHKKLSDAQTRFEKAWNAEAIAFRALQTASGDTLKAALERLAVAQENYDRASQEYSERLNAARDALDAATAKYAEKLSAYNKKVEENPNYPELKAKAELGETLTPEENEIVLACSEAETAMDTALTAMQEKEKAVTEVDSTKLDEAKAVMDEFQAIVDGIMESDASLGSAYKEAKKELETAAEEKKLLEEDLKQKRKSSENSLQLAQLELSDIGYQINKLREKINALSGGDDNQILAKVSGTVQSVEVNAGSTVAADTVLCTIEVPDMGYTTSFSVTNEQARRLKIGDSATISNYYWGSEIVATLESIKTDPKNPMTHKLLSFDLQGEVTAGSELSISVGQKGAGYDCILPSSAIKNDTNGSFVYVIEAKNSPLGNRYKARRAEVEVLASDDNNSAVTGGVESGDYVITVSNVPLKNGDAVRLADS